MSTKITYGLNGAEVTANIYFRVSDAEGNYQYDTVAVDVERVEEGFQFLAMVEYTCGDCGCGVDGPEGHSAEDCRIAAFESNEDRLADYRD